MLFGSSLTFDNIKLMSYNSYVFSQRCCSVWLFAFYPPGGGGGGRVVRWCWVNFQCRGVLLNWIRIGQGPNVVAVGAG